MLAEGKFVESYKFETNPLGKILYPRKIMDGFPSGQRGQTVNLLSMTSVVRIHPHPFGVLAQLGEHLPYKQRVTGSSPVGPILYRRVRDGIAHPAFLYLRIDNPPL